MLSLLIGLTFSYSDLKRRRRNEIDLFPRKVFEERQKIWEMKYGNEEMPKMKYYRRHRIANNPYPISGGLSGTYVPGQGYGVGGQVKYTHPSTGISVGGYGSYGSSGTYTGGGMVSFPF